MNKVYITAKEAEKEMQAARIKDGFVGDMEKSYISRMIKDAKRNSMIGDKLQLVVDPSYIHIPSWQRRLSLQRSSEIGSHYNKYKWDVPKVLYNDEKLYVIDGQHRIYGAFKAKLDGVVVEIMECSLTEAIDLFLNQTKDRSSMKPVDIYHAAIVAGKQDYISLKEICGKYNVAVKGDDVKNSIGTFTPISDGIRLIRISPKLFDNIIHLITKLEWNGYSDSYNGKAYKAKIIRVMRKMYAYYSGREKEMENILIKKCRGTEFFMNNVNEKEQDALFDFLSGIVRCEMESPFIKKKTKIA